MVGELAGANGDDDPTLPADMLEIYFNSDRGGAGGSDIWVATRTSTSEPFGAPMNVIAVSSTADERTPEISADGLTMYLASDSLLTGDFDIYVSTRASRQSPWSVPVRVVELSSSSSDEASAIASDGTTIYLDSTRLVASFDKLFVATRPDPASAWSMPSLIAELDGPGEEETPFEEASGLALWFSNDLGSGRDIYVATRAADTLPWSSAVRVDELSSPSHDDDPWVSPDGNTIYFTSERSGSQRIYMSTR